MSKLLAGLVVALLLLILSSDTAHAAFTISGAPTSVDSEQEFQVSATLTIGGSAGNTYYLRAALYHTDAPTSYFG